MVTGLMETAIPHMKTLGLEPDQDVFRKFNSMENVGLSTSELAILMKIHENLFDLLRWTQDKRSVTEGLSVKVLNIINYAVLFNCLLLERYSGND
jgi:hypothetical protein